MGTISKLLSGTAILIGIYLILSKSKDSARVVNALSGAYTSGVKALQGRN